MNCTQCGQRIDPGSAFCTNCGAKVIPTVAGAPTTGSAGRPVTPAAKHERPMGVVTVAILTAIDGLVLLGGSLFLFTLIGGAQGIMGAFGQAEQIPFWIVFLGIAMFLFGIFSLTASYGLWAFERWAPPLARLLWGISIPLTIVVVLGARLNLTTAVSGLFPIVLSVWVLVYLSKPEVQALY